jgi:hypothetical protein
LPLAVLIHTVKEVWLARITSALTTTGSLFVVFRTEAGCGSRSEPYRAVVSIALVYLNKDKDKQTDN